MAVEALVATHRTSIISAFHRIRVAMGQLSRALEQSTVHLARAVDYS